LCIAEKGVTVRDDSAEEHARVAEEARRAALEQANAEQERVTAVSERWEPEALTGPATQEVLGQLGLIYGGLILIGLYMVSRSSRHHRSTRPPSSASLRSRRRSRSSRRSCWSTGRKPSVAA
jgi:hypothetical protein